MDSFDYARKIPVQAMSAHNILFAFDSNPMGRVDEKKLGDLLERYLSIYGPDAWICGVSFNLFLTLLIEKNGTVSIEHFRHNGVLNSLIHHTESIKLSSTALCEIKAILQKYEDNIRRAAFGACWAKLPVVFECDGSNGLRALDITQYNPRTDVFRLKPMMAEIAGILKSEGAKIESSDFWACQG